MKTRALLVCPGRGSYARASLGSLRGRNPAAAEIIERIDAFRADLKRPTPTEMDASDSFRIALHVAGENASILTYAASLADAAEIADRYDVVGVTGNSMGFYTALAASGALPIDAANELVETMGSYQRDNVLGGQVLYPVSDTDWRPSPERATHVAEVLSRGVAAGHRVYVSIHLGGFEVLAGDDAGVKYLLEHLAAEARGEQTFPLQLPRHSAFHTPVMAATAARAQAELAALPFGAPRVPLFDGHGHAWRPRWADPDELFSYTLGAQVVETYDFDLALRTALRHTGAEVVVLLGPGNSLGGAAARVMIGEHWRGMASRADFDALQGGEHPALLSFGIPEQRERLTR